MFLILLILVIGLLIGCSLSYNGLQTLAQEVREKSSNVQISISKKLGLVNQLIDVVKNYQEGEQLTQLKVSQDNSAVGLAQSYQQSGAVLATVQGMAERFPNLKANEQYHRLVDSIQHCEQNIQNTRETYNKSVKAYNTKRVKIPDLFVARALGFPEAPYMEFDMTGLTEVNSLKSFKTDDGERLEQLLTGAGHRIAGVANQAGNAGKHLAEKASKEITEKIKNRQKRQLPENGSSTDGETDNVADETAEVNQGQS
jgi:LemA protein